MGKVFFTCIFAPLLSLFMVNIGFAAGAGDGAVAHLNGVDLSFIWAVPFICMLLSIAIFPLVKPVFWHNNFGKISAFWAVSLLIPFLFIFGLSSTIYELLHVLLLEYFPFVILLFSLFTVAGGINITGKLSGTPKGNLALLIIGTIIASWAGTTGAAMLLIRPVLKANAWRQHKRHIIVFFIFLVANIGGSLTPLGDPPLFLGFLKGVDFFWTTKAMFIPMLLMAIPLLVIFFALDSYYYRKENLKDKPLLSDDEKSGPLLKVTGKFNILLLVGVVFAVLLSGIWKPNIHFDIYHIPVHLQSFARDFLLLAIAAISWFFTPFHIRENNGFDWFPIQEVAKLFAGIFITIIPVIAILKAGNQGAMSPVIDAVSSNGNPVNYMYFWITGILSTFLDNAPTYLVFFNTAGGDATKLMGEYSQTLLAISMGAVFMGANSYIGNAPNFMVRSIAESSGVRMPSFFGYIGWSLIFLFPLFVIITWVIL